MNSRHQLWLVNYLKDKDRNASAAARAAGYSAKSSAMQGARMLARPDIQAAIAAHDAQSAKNSEKSQKQVENLADRVMSELSSLAFGNLQDCFDQDTGELLPINKLPREVAATLTAYENDKGFQKLKTASKLSALELLAKITQLVKQDHQNQAVQIIIGQPAMLPESPADRQPILPCWE
jgi:phage terminase small subunit